MKNIIIILSIILFSCNSKKNKDFYDISRGNNLEEIIAYELKNSPINDTTFLGFIFGSTIEETMSHANTLVSQGKITGRDGLYNYIFKIDENYSFNYRFKPQFHNGKLYSIMGMSLESESNTMMFLKIAALSDLYTSKYYFYAFSSGDDDESIRMLNEKWVNGIQLIDLKLMINQIFIEYSDTRVIKEVKALEQSQKNQEINATKSDI